VTDADAPSGNSATPAIDTTVAHPARVYDAMLGGTAHFDPDRYVAGLLMEAFPGGADAARSDVRSNRAFLRWAVRHLAIDHGVRQFLDIGSGIPNADNVHAVAQQAAADARIVYVDNDPVVLAHAHELLRSTDQGATDYVNQDLRDPAGILEAAAGTLDLTQPVAVLLFAILHFEMAGHDPYDLVRQLVDGVAPGSYLAISHLASDIQPAEMAALAESIPPTAVHMRSRREVARFFDGLELIAPGLTTLDERRPLPDHDFPLPAGWTTPYYVGIARKPALS
jgi:SAM-dependent methyltransferase